MSPSLTELTIDYCSRQQLADITVALPSHFLKVPLKSGYILEVVPLRLKRKVDVKLNSYFGGLEGIRGSNYQVEENNWIT